MKNTPTRGSLHMEDTTNQLPEMIENQILRLPVGFYLWAGFGSILSAAALQYTGKRQRSVFIGHWAPTFFILGLYARIAGQMNRSKA